MSIPVVVLRMQELIGVLSWTAPARRPQGEKTLDPIWERKPLGLTMAPVRNPRKVVPATAPPSTIKGALNGSISLHSSSAPFCQCLQACLAQGRRPKAQRRERPRLSARHSSAASGLVQKPAAKGDQELVH